MERTGRPAPISPLMRPASHTPSSPPSGVPSLALQLQRGKKTRRRRTPRDGPTPEMEAVMWHKEYLLLNGDIGPKDLRADKARKVADFS